MIKIGFLRTRSQFILLTLSGFSMHCVSLAARTIFVHFNSTGGRAAILFRRVITFFTFRTSQRDDRANSFFLCHTYLNSQPLVWPQYLCFPANYSIISRTLPAPTVRPPSRIAKVVPCSIATGTISSTVMSTLSPGITISTFGSSSMVPVTSMVRTKN